MSMEPAQYLQRIIENILSAGYKDLAEVTLENAKKRIIDILGCVICGANAAGNAGLVELSRGWGGAGESTILIHGGKIPAHNAALVNSTMARSYDFETVGAYVEGVDYPSHISGTTVIAALSLGESKKVSGRELLTALILGDDLACRIVATTIAGFSSGWDCVGTINPLGATAIAGRLLGLTAREMQSAFGLVLSQLAGSFQNIWDGTMGFKLQQGLAGKSGIVCAEMAKAGIIGPEDALFGDFGYFRLYSDGCRDPELLIKGLGSKHYMEETFKAYPCCRANHAAVNCAMEIVSGNSFEAGKIKDIIIYASPMVAQMFVSQPFKIRHIPQIDAAFNISYCVANVLLRKSITLEHFQEASIRDPQIESIANKIKVREYEETGLSNLGASLKVVMDDGQELFTHVEFAKSDPVQSPLTLDEVKDKFMNNVAFSRTISAENASNILSLIETLEEVDDVSVLINLLA